MDRDHSMMSKLEANQTRVWILALLQSILLCFACTSSTSSVDDSESSDVVAVEEESIDYISYTQPSNASNTVDGELQAITACDMGAYGSPAIVRVLSIDRLDVQRNDCSGTYAQTATIYNVETVIAFEGEPSVKGEFELVLFDNEAHPHYQENDLWLVSGRYYNQQLFGTHVVKVHEINEGDVDLEDRVSNNQYFDLPQSVVELKAEFDEARRSRDTKCAPRNWLSDEEFRRLVFDPPPTYCTRSE